MPLVNDIPPPRGEYLKLATANVAAERHQTHSKLGLVMMSLKCTVNSSLCLWMKSTFSAFISR